MTARKDYVKILAFAQAQARYFRNEHRWVPADMVDDLAQSAVADLLAYNDRLLYWTDDRKALLARCCKQSFVRFITRYVVKPWRVEGAAWHAEAREAMRMSAESRARVDLFVDAACRYLVLLENADDRAVVCAMINLLNNAAGYYDAARRPRRKRKGAYDRLTRPRLASVAEYLGYGTRSQSMKLRQHAFAIRRMMHA